MNKTLQNFMYTMLEDSTSVAPRESLGVMIDLYRKNVWCVLPLRLLLVLTVIFRNDAKTVNVISAAVFHSDAKVVSLALHFFLTNKKARTGNDSDDEDSDEVPIPTQRSIIREHGIKFKKKTKARKRKLDKALSEAKNKRKARLEKEIYEERQYNVAAMLLLHDPQSASCSRILSPSFMCPTSDLTSIHFPCPSSIRSSSS